MTTELLVHAGIGEIRVAALRDGVLDRYWSEPALTGEGGAPRVGDIILGRVKRVLSSSDAAFVDIGGPRAGFLAAKDARGADGDGGRKRSISECVREGEAILVQVAKEPIGDKGARLTTAVALPGRLVVLMPESGAVAVSRAIEDEEERSRLTTLVTEMATRWSERGATKPGFIARTAAAGATADDLERDSAALLDAWASIDTARRRASPPMTLRRELEGIARLLRDELVADVARVLIDDASLLQAARAYAARVLPSGEDRIVPFETGNVFDAYGIEEQIAALGDTKVPLPSGGWVSIEPTEALVAIDVNSGSHVAAGDFAATALAVNLEAAEVIARQIRLRGLGGLIIVDFMRVPGAQHGQRVLDRFRAALAHDRVPTEVSISPLGFVALTRKRVRAALDARSTEACSACDGHGRRATAETVGREILRRIERSAQAAPGKTIRVAAAPEVADWLETERTMFAAELARRGAANMTLVADPERRRESFSVETTG
jgi:ribonuclease G